MEENVANETLADALLAKLNAGMANRLLLPGDAPEVAASDLNLDGINPQIPRTVSVELRLPSRSELRALAKSAHIPDAELKEKTLAGLEEALDRYYPNGEAATPWQTTLHHGKATVVFEAVPHDADSIVNRTYNEILNESPRACEVVECDGEKIAFPPHRPETLIAIDGRIILEESQKFKQENFGRIAEFISIANEVDSFGNRPFLPHVKLRSHISFSINHLAGLGLNQDDLCFLIENPDTIKTILFHEQGHSEHRDQYFELGPAKKIVQQFMLSESLQYFFAEIQKDPTDVANALLGRNKNNVDETLKGLEVLNKNFSILENAFSTTLAHLEEGPAYLNLPPLTLAVTPHFNAGLLAQLATIPDPLAQNDYDRIRSSWESRHYIEPAPTPEMQQPVVATLKELIARHSTLLEQCGKLRAVQKTYDHMTEFRADIYAAEHGGSVTQLFQDIPQPDSDTHPSGETRILVNEAVRDALAHRDAILDPAHRKMSLETILRVAAIKDGISRPSKQPDWKERTAKSQSHGETPER